MEDKMRTKLKENETLIIKVKKHWIILLKPLILFVVMFMLCIYVRKYKLFGFEKMLKDILPWGVGFFFSYFVYVYLKRQYDIWGVTDQRIIDERGIITHKTKESPIEKVNNVDVVQTLAGRIFNYGNLRIQTAATEGDSWIQFVEKPKELQTIILKQIDEYKRKSDIYMPNISFVKEQTQIDLTDTKECPYCAEIIKKKAKICRFCGKDISDNNISLTKISEKSVIDTNLNKDEKLTEMSKISNKQIIDKQSFNDKYFVNKQQSEILKDEKDEIINFIKILSDDEEEKNETNKKELTDKDNPFLWQKEIRKITYK